MNVNKDLNYAFALSRKCLWLLGVWPDPQTSVSDFRRPNIRFVIAACCMSIYVILPQVRNMIRSWGNVSRIVEHLPSVNYGLMALIKLTTTFYHGETLRTLMISVMNDWLTSKNDWERSTMLKIARRARSLSFKCYLSITCAVSIYIWSCFVKFQLSMHRPQRILIYQFNYPYNSQKSPNYEITFLAQFIGGLFVALTNCSIDSFISILLLHMCAQLINLRTALNIIVEKLANRTISTLRFKKGLATIILRHEHLIRNVKEINNCYSKVSFLQMLATTFQLCFQSFQIYTIITDHLDVPIARIVFLFFYTAMVLTHFYVYCYSAEKLITESTRMAYGMYQCKWYDLPSKNARDLMIIVYRSRVPLRLTAEKFGFFSLELFGTTLKTSMGYLSALLTMKD